MLPTTSIEEMQPPSLAPAEAQENASPPEQEYTPDKPFHYRFTNKQKKEIAEHVCRMIEDGRRAFFAGGRPANVAAWRDAYKSIAPGNRVLPFVDAPNYHTVLSQVMTDTLVARTFKVTTGIKPFCKVESLSQKYQEQAERIEGFYQAVLTNQMDYVSWQRRALLNTAIDGTFFMKTCWDRRVERWYEDVPLTMDVLKDLGYEYQTPLPDGTELPIEDTEGVERTVRVGEKERILREKIIYNAPRKILFPLEDHVMYPATSKSIEAATLFGQRMFKTLSDVWAGVDAGLYDKAAVLRMFKEKPRPYNKAENVDGWSDADAGAEYENGLGTEAEPQTLHDGAHLEFFEACIKFDPDYWRTYHRRKENGATDEELLSIPRRDRWHVVRVDRATKTLLALFPFPYAFPDGQTWYDVYRLYEDPQSFYGMSVPQKLAPIQKETNDLTNITMAMNLLGLSVRIIRDRNSRDTTKPFRPGVEEIIVDDPQTSYRIENISVNTVPSREDRAYLNDQAERAIAASEATQGVNPSSTRTASENNLVAAQGAIRLDVPLSVWQVTNGSGHNKDMLLFPDYMDGIAEYRLSGGDFAPNRPLFGFATPDDFEAGVRVYAYGDTLNTNEELKAQAAEKMWMMAERMPWIQGDWNKLRALASEIYTVFGQGAPDAFIGTREEVQAKMAERDEAAKTAPPAIEPPKISLSDNAALALMLSAMPEHQQQAVVQMFQTLKQAGLLVDEDTGQEEAQANLQMKAAEADQKLQTNAQLAQQKLAINEAQAEQKSRIDLASAMRTGRIQEMLAETKAKQMAQTGVANANKSVN